MEKELFKIIETYGIKNQTKKFGKESFELIEAIIDDEKTIKDVEEKIADVLVLIGQFITYFEINLDDIEKIFKRKVNHSINKIVFKNLENF